MIRLPLCRPSPRLTASRKPNLSPLNALGVFGRRSFASYNDTAPRTNFWQRAFSRPKVDLTWRSCEDKMILSVESISGQSNTDSNGGNSVVKVAALADDKLWHWGRLPVLSAYREPKNSKVSFLDARRVRMPMTHDQAGGIVTIEKYLVMPDEPLTVGQDVAVFKVTRPPSTLSPLQWSPLRYANHTPLYHAQESYTPPQGDYKSDSSGDAIICGACIVAMGIIISGR